MIVYPAIDIRGGKVVRLKLGDPAKQTVFGEDPLAMAAHWQSQGARWLHVVNLDGALEAANSPLDTIRAMADRGIAVQLGGGIRSRAAVAAALSAGAARVVIGTAAVENPQLVESCIAEFGSEAICIALDARNGHIATRGWTEVSEQTPTAFGKRLAAIGVRHALFTDVSRDGMLSGSAVESTIGLARDTGLTVIASGGVQSVAEIRTLAASGVVGGAVIGMALYTGIVTLPDALAAAGGV
jgi:phosphoribosylformimino-5-aminoimidazole carboxamide ribotide isomerase